MEKQDATRLHLVELQNEVLMHENEMLTCENAKLRNMCNELKRSLDEAVRISKQQTAERVSDSAKSEASEGTAAMRPTHVRESEGICDDGCKG